MTLCAMQRLGNNPENNFQFSHYLSKSLINIPETETKLNHQLLVNYNKMSIYYYLTDL